MTTTTFDVGTPKTVRAPRGPKRNLQNLAG